MPAFRDGGIGRVLSAASLLIPLILSALIMRSWFSEAILPPPPRMQGETTQAYRYSQMIARGGRIPAVDGMVMHPDGMITSENSIFEEYLAGGLYRVSGTTAPFDSFMRLFCLAFPLFGMAGLFLWLREVGFEKGKAMLGSLAYGFLLPAMLRARGESLYRETVAIPIILFLCWSIEKAVRSADFRRSLPPSAAAAILLAAGNAAWKVTGFIAAAILFYVLVMNTKRRLPLPAVILPAFAQIGSALLIPHMASEGAWLSPATITAAGLLVSAGARITALPLLVAGAATVTALFRFNEATAHVSSMILAKFRFFFIHPPDPLMLDPDARLFWVSGYETPPPGEVILLFGPLLLFAAFGMRKLWRRGPTLLRWALPVSMAAYLMMDRLHVLLAPVLVAPALETIRNRWRAPVFALILAAQAVFVIPFAGILEGAGLHTQSSASLLAEPELAAFLEWARSSTDPDESFLSYWHVSGFLSAYAGRPAVTGTFFENASNRRNIQEFAVRVFQPEDSLVSFMERTDADYLVYQADFLLDGSSSGLLYLAGHRIPPAGSAASMMQYTPEALRRMDLVFQGPSLRVFALAGSEAPPCSTRAGVLFDERYSRLFGDYERAAATIADPLGTAFSLATSGRANRAPDLLSAALILVCSNEGRVEDATGILQELVTLHLDGLYAMDALAGDFETYLESFGPDPLVRVDLARLYLSAGMRIEAEAEISQALLEAPGLSGSPYLEGLESLTGLER